MKKYIAFHNSSNSGVQTKEKVHEWAANLLGQGKIGTVHVAEVIETVERATPIIEVKAFSTQLDEPSLKVA